jgi:hypothetical protein
MQFAAKLKEIVYVDPPDHGWSIGLLFYPTGRKLAAASRVGLTPSPTCQTWARWFPQGDAAIRQRNGSRECQPSSVKPMEGFSMSMEEHAAHKDPEFFPENVDFLGFVGGWDCYIGVDTVQILFYLIRAKDLDWLETVAKYCNNIMSRSCVMSIPRHGSNWEAAARLNWKTLWVRLPRS